MKFICRAVFDLANCTQMPILVGSLLGNIVRIFDLMSTERGASAHKISLELTIPPFVLPNAVALFVSVAR